jgi:hypothetical protein
LFRCRTQRLALPSLSSFAGRQSEALPIHLQNMDVMREAIEQCAGESFRAEDRGPLIEWQIAGDKRGATFIALAEHLEEQFRTNGGERHVSALVHLQLRSPMISKGYGEMR